MKPNSHQAFISRLDKSRFSTFVVAYYLHKRNWDVTIPAFIYPDENSNWEENVDDGDLYIKKEDKGTHRIDVKHVNLDFTCHEDFPYRYMYVADIRAIERADPFPLAYMIINKAASHLGIVWGKTKDHWEPHDTFASNTQKIITVKRCPIELVEFRSLND